MVRTSTTPFCVGRLRAVDFEAGGSFFGCVFFHEDAGVRKAGLPTRGFVVLYCISLVVFFIWGGSLEIECSFDVSDGFDVIGRA